MNVLHEDPHAAERASSQQAPTTGAEGDARTATAPPVWGAVAVATIIFALIYPPFGVGPLAFLALAPIALILMDPTIACTTFQAAFAGFVFGTLASMAIVGPWMYSAASVYFGKSMLFSLAFTLFVNTSNVAVFYAPTFALIRTLAGASALVRIVGAAAIWTTLEYVRAKVLLGNPWALLGQGLYDIPLLREAASIGGIWLLTFACAAAGAAFGVALQRQISRGEQRRAIAIGVAAPLLLVVAAFAGRWMARPPDASNLKPLRVAVVQAEIGSTDLWKAELRVAHLEKYLTLTATLEPGSIDLVVWPENAVPFLLDADARTRGKLAALARHLNAALLLGAPRSETSSAGGTTTARFFNSAFFFPADGGPPQTYDKIRLLPYVEEEMGTGTDFPSENRYLSPTGSEADGGYTAGAGPALFDVRGWKIAPLICLEAVYPDFARDAVGAGADLLVNLSNDAWFSGGAGPEQHFAMSSLRAVENRRPLVRAANGGISGAVGTDGALVGPTIRRAEGVTAYTLEPPPRMRTLYQRHGDWFAALCAMVAGLCLALARSRARRDAS